MLTTISKDDISLIVETMKSRYGEDTYGYIDRETGEVLIGCSDYPLDIIPNEEDEEDENYEEVEAEFIRRYFPIPQEGSRDTYQDMIDFIETVEDERLQDLLGVAVQGRGAFGRFKDVLHRPEYELERNRWFMFSEKREYDRAVEWLTSQNFSIAA